jgi:hypothetical protein
MGKQGDGVRNVFLLLFLLLQGCQSAAPVTSPQKLIPSSVHAPANIQRLIVLYPRTSVRDVTSTYHRLEGAAFQLKEQRPSLRIVDRSNLSVIMSEQRFQLSGAVSDESAIRVGRLLGADSVLLYHVEVPSLRDQVFAKYRGDLPPVMVTSKIIMVESAEVVFHNVVTTPVDGFRNDQLFFLTESHPEPFIRAALERGIAQTISDLHYAFR